MSGIHEIRIHTLGELVEAVTPEHADPQSGRLRERAVYRGVPVADCSLLSSLDRLGTPELPPHAKGHLEAHLLRNFIRYSRPHLAALPERDLELLVIAQHHGLPTRLLDWTHSPLVAAHFATRTEDRSSDRVVWRLDWGRLHDHYRLPPLALLSSDLQTVLHGRGFASLWELIDPGAHEGETFVALLEPPAIDQRIMAQSAAFTFSTDRSRSLQQVLAASGLETALTRCVIPAAAVQRIRDQLDLCGISERRLFPDLDGVAAEMRRYYAATAPPRKGEGAGRSA